MALPSPELLPNAPLHEYSTTMWEYTERVSIMKHANKKHFGVTHFKNGQKEEAALLSHHFARFWVFFVKGQTNRTEIKLMGREKKKNLFTSSHMLALLRSLHVQRLGPDT